MIKSIINKSWKESRIKLKLRKLKLYGRYQSFYHLTCQNSHFIDGSYFYFQSWLQMLEWSKKTNLCGKYCDLIFKKIQTLKLCQWGECCRRNWSDWISNEIQTNKIWRKLWWKLIQFVIVNTQSTQMKKWWDIIRKLCQLIWFQDKLRNWSWVSLLVRFEMCVIWFELRFKCVRFER
jgi:hypothetical protein